MVQMLVVMVVVVVMTGLTGKHGMTWAWLDGCGARRLGGRGPKKRGGQGSWAGPAGAQRRSPTPLFDKARRKPKSGGSGWWTGLAETRPDMGQRAASAAAAACAGTGSEVCVCVCVRARAGGCVGVGPVGGRCLARAHIHPSIHLACSHSLLLPVALYVGTYICTDSAGAPLFLRSIPSHARLPANVTRTRPRDGERVRDGWNTYRTVCPPCKCTL